MTVFRFDNTFEGLLTCVFDAYFRRTFPDLLLCEGEPLPLFHDEVVEVHTDEKKPVVCGVDYKKIIRIRVEGFGAMLAGR